LWSLFPNLQKYHGGNSLPAISRNGLPFFFGVGMASIPKTFKRQFKSQVVRVFCVEQRLEAFSTPNSMRLICLQHQRMFRGAKKLHGPLKLGFSGQKNSPTNLLAAQPADLQPLIVTLGAQTGHALDEMQFVNFITAFVRGLGSAFGIVNKEWMF